MTANTHSTAKRIPTLAGICFFSTLSLLTNTFANPITFCHPVRSQLQVRYTSPVRHRAMAPPREGDDRSTGAALAGRDAAPSPHSRSIQVPSLAGTLCRGPVRNLKSSIPPHEIRADALLANGRRAVPKLRLGVAAIYVDAALRARAVVTATARPLLINLFRTYRHCQWYVAGTGVLGLDT